MTRPVRPVALVILTLCMIYPGVTLLFQGLYPFVAGESFMLSGQLGPWVTLGQKLGIPPVVAPLLKTALGLLWVLGVPGLWAGDRRAWPLVLLAAAGSVLYPWGPSAMGIIALVCLLGFREDPDRVLA
ncbi:MAG: hypothetical protein HZC42_15360 [Candidatus Eisenbacteria bacterium]|nr:hypothetical protein [Candidatus Eisenbacteria bacterium]